MDTAHSNLSNDNSKNEDTDNHIRRANTKHYQITETIIMAWFHPYTTFEFVLRIIL